MPGTCHIKPLDSGIKPLDGRIKPLDSEIKPLDERIKPLDSPMYFSGTFKGRGNTVYIMQTT
jgi:hypothetical protein